ncbi:glycosyltransferase family 32 [Ilyonectria robusta]
MDTLCNETFPLHQVESAAEHQAILKSTLPTGVTNDFMISSAGHPAFAAAIAKLPTYYNKTRLWARLLPYGAIMISSGPFFLTMMVMDYLMKQPLLSPPTVQVVNQTQLAPYITDLESCTWHQEDAQLLMWLGERPWAWFSLGGIGLVAGIYLTNCALMSVWKTLTQKASTVNYNTKSANTRRQKLSVKSPPDRTDVKLRPPRPRCWGVGRCRHAVHAIVSCARWPDPLPFVTRRAKVPTDSWRDKTNSYNSLSRSAGSLRQDFFCRSPASVNQRLISRNPVPGTAKSSKSCQQRDQITLKPTINDCNPNCVESRNILTSPCRPNQPKGRTAL